jgi:hypothetical protein
MMSRIEPRIPFLALAFSVLMSQPSKAVEYGLSEYVLGLAIPMSGYVPPPGLYFQDVYYLYSGVWRANAFKVNYNFVANASIVNWVTDIKLFDGSFGVAASIPIAGVNNTLTIPSAGPAGFQQIKSSDSVNSIANIELGAFLGWHQGEHHWDVSLTGFIPTGYYSPNVIAFTSLNRPAIDLKGAYTFLGATGIEASGVLGLTINSVNTATNYQSGAELHFEWALNQHFPFGLAAGIGGYFLQQVTGDSGPGDYFGAYKGRVAGIGPMLSYTVKVDTQQFTLSGRWFHEFAARDRVQGDSIFASLALQL